MHGQQNIKKNLDSTV